VEPTLIGDWFGIVGGQQIHVDFREDGSVLYEIYSDNRRQIILLTYRIEGDVLVTDQPTHPQEVRTAFRFKDGQLVLTLDGVETTYERRNLSPN
jgi:hypothetical protein